ncbi:hypothetical protein BJF93_00545 [Xaviernesmea oryzae]|uniref:Uncharacterized protein n=2 Tax=Xaviernesmea oryzae TaxID=464029 RepID=A0A1Q9B0E6_9HYPH|nr:hypothetical protein BJF93_00545 [Xaviernesmea oryzae]
MDSSTQQAVDARALLDAAYQKRGKKADETATINDWHNKIGLGTFDRGALQAMIVNRGGLFSKLEVDAAQIEMQGRKSAAIFSADPTGLQKAAAAKASIDFLDAGGDDEKASFAWAEERASAQIDYKAATKSSSSKAADVTSSNSIVKLLVAAREEATVAGKSAADYISMPSYQKAVDLSQLINRSRSSVSWTL